MKSLIYERLPIDMAAFSSLPRAIFLYAMWGKERVFLRFISEGRESARERGAISDIGKPASLYTEFPGWSEYPRMDYTVGWIFLSYMCDCQCTCPPQHLPSTWAVQTIHKGIPPGVHTKVASGTAHHEATRSGIASECYGLLASTLGKSTGGTIGIIGDTGILQKYGIL